MNSPREYTAIKFSAPPGSCKCGRCQLVPREALDAWALELDRARPGWNWLLIAALAYTAAAWIAAIAFYNWVTS